MRKKVKAGDVTILDALELDQPKTREISALLDNLNMDRHVLLVTERMDDNIALSCRNIQRLDLATAADFNTYQVLRNQQIVILKDAMEGVESRLVPVEKPEKEVKPEPATTASAEAKPEKRKSEPKEEIEPEAESAPDATVEAEPETRADVTEGQAETAASPEEKTGREKRGNRRREGCQAPLRMRMNRKTKNVLARKERTHEQVPRHQKNA